MSAIQIRRTLARRRRRITVLMVFVTLAGALALHHAAPSADMHGMSEAAACLAVLAVGVAVAVVAAGACPVTLPRAPLRASLRAAVVARVPRARPPRAGPLFLRLRVVRR